MDRLTAMQVFAEVADRASLTEAANALDMSRAMVSRYLLSLEGWLGTRLLHRTTRRVSLTAAGEEVLAGCRQVLDMTDHVQAVASDGDGAPRGMLRITTSTSFAEAFLAAAVAEFMARHPLTRIELIAVERAVNLVEERIDLAVRIANRLEPTLVARRLGLCRSAVCAAPAYLASSGMPVRADQLREHRCITHAFVGRTEYRLVRDGVTVRVPVSGPLQCNEATVVRAAALAGAGIAMLPTYLVAKDIAAGRLVRLLPDHEPEAMGIHAVYLSRQHQPHLLRLMLDFLAERFSNDVAPWDSPAVQAPSKRPSHSRKTLRTRA